MDFLALEVLLSDLAQPLEDGQADWVWDLLPGFMWSLPQDNQGFRKIPGGGEDLDKQVCPELL